MIRRCKRGSDYTIGNTFSVTKRSFKLFQKPGGAIVDNSALCANKQVEHCPQHPDILSADVIPINNSAQLTFEPGQDAAFSSMPDSFFIPEVSKRQTRSKHVCSGCDTKIYGKSSLNVICGDCELPFVRKE